ncbi:MAG: FISUMP domain-containing protein [Bacteroidota bacterium]
MKNLKFLRGLNMAIILFISILFFPCLVNGQTKGTFVDTRDNRVYAWVKIGSQTWMAENLKYDAKVGSWAYNNDSTNVPTFGRLYNWKTAQASCPKGWRVPSDKEWGALIQAYGGGGEAGLRMIETDTVVKVRGHAVLPGGTPYSTLLGGIRHPDGSCIGLNYWGGCWSSGKVNDTVANTYLFAHGRKDLGVSTNDKSAGFTVRCVKAK